MANPIFINATDWNNLGTSPPTLSGLPSPFGGNSKGEPINRIINHDEYLRKNFGLVPGHALLDSGTGIIGGPTDGTNVWREGSASTDGIKERIQHCSYRKAFALFDTEHYMNYDNMTINSQLETDAQKNYRLQTGIQLDGNYYTYYPGVYASRIYVDQHKQFESWAKDVDKKVPMGFWQHPRNQRDFKDWVGSPTSGNLTNTGGFAENGSGSDIPSLFCSNEVAYLGEVSGISAWMDRVNQRAWIIYNTHQFQNPTLKAMWISPATFNEPIQYHTLDEMEFTVRYLIDNWNIQCFIWWYAGDYWNLNFDSEAPWLQVTKKYSGINSKTMNTMFEF